MVPFISDQSRLGKRKKTPTKKKLFSLKCIFGSVSGLMAPHLSRLCSFWGCLTCPGEPGYPWREVGLMLKPNAVPSAFGSAVSRGGLGSGVPVGRAAAWQLLTDTSAFSGGPHCVAKERRASQGGWAPRAGEAQSVSEHF